MGEKKDQPLTHLLWLDLEMTGLDVEKEVIIEVGAIITDLDFHPVAEYETVVKQPQSYLDKMDEWNREHHGKSGLLAKIPYGKDPHLVEEELGQLIDQHFSKEERVVLAGNSIGQDRLFINKYFTKLAERLHYRMLDVTSWKLIFKNKFQLEPEKQNGHRALDDIKESIEELQFYLQYIQTQK